MNNVMNPPPALTQTDITTIRDLLPFNFRQQLATKTELTPRQISEVFNLRTTNPDHNQKVWEVIKRWLRSAGRDDLAEKCKQRIAEVKFL